MQYNTAGGSCLLHFQKGQLCFAKHGYKNGSEKKRRFPLPAVILLLQCAALILELLPNAAKSLRSIGGPNEVGITENSYFSLSLAFGGAEFAPLLTGIFTIVILLLCVIELVIGKEAIGFKIGAAVCCAIAFYWSLMPIFRHKADLITIPNYGIAVFTFLSLLTAIWAMIHFCRKHNGN